MIIICENDSDNVSAKILHNFMATLEVDGDCVEDLNNIISIFNNEKLSFIN